MKLTQEQRQLIEQAVETDDSVFEALQSALGRALEELGYGPDDRGPPWFDWLVVVCNEEPEQADWDQRLQRAFR